MINDFDILINVLLFTGQSVFDEDEVLKYLYNFYKVDNIIQDSQRVHKPESIQPQKHMRLDDINRETELLRSSIKSSMWGLNSTDISLCVAFYLLCTAIIILIYYHFTVNKRMSLSLAIFKV